MSVQSSKRANLSNVLYPDVHLFCCFGQQVKDARGGLDHKQVLILILTFSGPHLCLDGDLALLQVDGSDWFSGTLATVIFQNIRIPAHPTPPQNKPSLSPWLREKGTESERQREEQKLDEHCSAGWTQVKKSPLSFRSLGLVFRLQAFTLHRTHFPLFRSWHILVLIGIILNNSPVHVIPDKINICLYKLE